MEVLWIKVVFAVIVGLCVGSFLNVCIYRIPLEKSIVSPRSFCPKCLTPITWFRNIPVFSFLLQKGRCFQCGQTISWRYPFVEILTAIFFLLVVLRQPAVYAWPFEAYFLCALIITTCVDLDHWIIPDKITLPGILIGFVSSFFVPGHHWSAALLGILFGGGSLFFVGWAYEKLTSNEGIGGGDVKYLAMAGAFLGLEKTILVLVLSSMLGSVFGVALLLFKKITGKSAIPFGPFLAAATLIAFLFGSEIWQWYFNLQNV